MSLKGYVFRSINAMLAKADMELRLVSHDFDARLDQPAHLQRMFSALGKAGDEWLKWQNFFPYAASSMQQGGLRNCTRNTSILRSARKRAEAVSTFGLALSDPSSDKATVNAQR